MGKEAKHKNIFSFSLFLIVISVCALILWKETITNNSYKGKWVIINYWATWCKPCLKEMPELNNLYKNNKTKLVVLGVSYDKLSQKEIKAVAKKFSIEYPLLSHFPIHRFGVKRVSVLPTTFIINPKGHLTKTLKGPQTEKNLRAYCNLAILTTRYPLGRAATKRSI